MNLSKTLLPCTAGAPVSAGPQRARLLQLTPIVSAVVLFSVCTTTAGSRAHFLSHGPSVKAFGRGETGTATADDLSSLFYNPSLAAGLQHERVSFSHYALFDGSMYNHAAAGLPFLKTNYIGFSTANLRSGNVEVRKRINDTPSVIQTNHWYYMLSLARKCESLAGLNIGLSAKYVYMDLYGHTGGSVGLDAGVSGRFKGPVLLGNRSILAVGAAVQNLVPPSITLVSEKEVLESIYRIGMALHLPVIYRMLSSDTLSLFADVSSDGRSNDCFLGSEYLIGNRFSVRTGYYRNHATAGAGYRFRNMHIDYAIDLLGYGNFNRLGLAYFFKQTDEKRTRKNTLIDEARKTLKEAREERITREKEISSLFKNALSDFRKKRYLRATDTFKNIILNYPGYETARIYHEKISGEMSRTASDTGETDYERLSYANGYIYYFQHNLADALNEWKKVLRINPEHEEVKEYVEKVSSRLHDLERVAMEKEFEASLRLMFERGVSEYQNRNWVACIKTMEQIQEMCKNRQYVPAADYHLVARDYIAGSVDELTKTIQKPKTKALSKEKSSEPDIDEKGAENRYREGLVLYAQGRLFDAAKQWEIALRLNPKHKKAQKALQKIRQEQGEQ